MSSKTLSLNLDDIIRRYQGGESVAKIAASLGVGKSTVQKRLRDAGVMRTLQEATALRPKHRPETIEKLDEVVKLRQSGLTQREIGERFGVPQATVSNWLLSRGVRADMHVSRQRYADSLTPQQRAKQAEAAHEAVRGMKRTDADLIARAHTKQIKQSHATDTERLLAQALTARGLDPVLQLAVYKYNLDIGVEPVAMELFGGNWHAQGPAAARMPQRLKDIADRGFNTIMVWTHAVHAMDIGAIADEVVSFRERSCSDPSFSRQYRVIWCDGEFIAAGSVDDNKLTLIPTGIRGTYARRR